MCHVSTLSLTQDGTMRKERRIREGYTPQDEQPVYMSRGALVRARACADTPHMLLMASNPSQSLL